MLKKRRVTTVEERKGIIEDTKLMSYSQVAHKYDVSYSAVKKIVQRKHSYADLPEMMKKRKSIKGSSYSFLNDAVFERFTLLTQQKIPVYSKDLKSYARKYASKARIAFNPSEQWLESFLSRYQLRIHQINQEMSLVESREPLNADPTAKYAITKYPKEDVYCADEMGFFFRADPTFILPLDDRHGLSIPEERATVMLCSNISGTSKYPPVVVSAAPNPFDHAPELKEKVGVSYFHQENSWMTADIFRGFVQYLDENMTRPTLLIVDDAPIHKVDGLELRNLRVLVLPSQGASFLSPFEAGIFDSFKCGYRKQFLQTTISRLASSIPPEIRLGGLSSLKKPESMEELLPLVRRSWDMTSAHVIRQSWRASGLLDIHSGPPSIDLTLPYLNPDMEELRATMKTYAAINQIPVLTFDEYMTLDKFAVVMEFPSEDEMIDQQIEAKDKSTVAGEKSDRVLPSEALPGVDVVGISPISIEHDVIAHPSLRDAIKSVETLLVYSAQNNRVSRHMPSLLSLREALYQKDN